MVGVIIDGASVTLAILGMCYGTYAIWKLLEITTDDEDDE